MVYSKYISTPANTALASPVRTEIRVTKGLVYKVEFYFPPGPSGLMGAAVFDGLYQAWPSTVGEYFASDDETISFDDLYVKESPPFSFQCFTYNLDTAFAHSVGVRIGLVSDEAFMARFLPNKSRAVFEKLRKQMQAEQIARAAQQLEVSEGTLLARLVSETE